MQATKETSVCLIPLAPYKFSILSERSPLARDAADAESAPSIVEAALYIEGKREKEKERENETE